MKRTILFFLTFTFCLSAKEACYCGTWVDREVDKIGDQICNALVEMGFLKPPEYYVELEEDVCEDCDCEGNDYIDVIRWKPSRNSVVVYGFSEWKCEYIHVHRFGSYGSLDSPIITFELLDEISSEIESYRSQSITDTQSALKHLKSTYGLYEYDWKEKYKRNRNELLEMLAKDMKKYSWFQEKFENLTTWVSNAYENIFTNCLEKHGSDSAYYHRGFIAFARGDFFSAMQDLKRIQCSENLSTRRQIEAHYQLGKTQNLLGLYDDAIEALTRVIEADPEKADAYFERAAAYFEKGQFDEAFEDYIQSEFKPTPILASSLSSLEFAGGLIKGASFGAAHTVEHFVPSMLCSLQGLANGLWSFACDPKEVSKEMVQAARNIYDFIQDNSTLEVVKALIPEFDTLVGDWQEHSEFRKGELIGTILGKYGTDLFLFAGSAKALKLYEELRVANAALTFDAMKSLEKQKRLLEKSAKWHEATLVEIKKARASASKLGKEFAGANLTETEARKLLHNIGIETFPVPKGIDTRHFHLQVTEAGGGMFYINKGKDQIRVRVMPGNPLSKYPSQRQPYVVHLSPKGYLDKNGKVTNRKSAESHIPVGEYDFNKLQKAGKE